ncbi:MAG TPA: PAS domain-containing sensor histidine kinase [Gammaproteobacteria bacterium]|nr:PAS domain-containing sensor histidine kinase [Gammaproteobacteria bacterium]
MTKLSLDESTILDQVHCAIVVLNDDNAIIQLNMAAQILFGMSQRQAMLIPLQTLLPGEQGLFTHIQRVNNNQQRLIQRHQPIYIQSQGEILVDYVIQLIDVDSSEPKRLLEFYFVDLSAAEKPDDSLQLQQLVRGLAHEIKNPLGGIRGAAQLLERQLNNAELMDYTQVIIHEADRLRDLMNNMLGPYKKGQKTSVNIHQVLQHIRHLVCAEGDERLKIVQDYDPSLPTVEADFNQLVQVFLNIVRNAVQAMNGVGKITLKTRAKRKLSIHNQQYRIGVLVEVIDEGPGIPKEIEQSLFYPLVTGRKDGNGLGLYLCQTLVNRNNGVITGSSQSGRTVFSVILPVEVADE